MHLAPPGSELGACFVAGAPCVPGVGALPPCLSLDSCTTHAAAAVRVADLRIEHASSAAGVGRGVHARSLRAKGRCYPLRFPSGGHADAGDRTMAKRLTRR
jgi:hypothetical protein